MAELLGLLISLIALLVVLLPVLTFIRMGRLARELEELSQRVADLERGTASAFTSSESANFGAAPAFTPPEPSSFGATTGVAAPGAAAFAAARSAPAVPGETSAPVPPPRVDHATAAPGPVTAPELDEPDLEERIGGRGLLYTGILVLLFGVSFFLKYAFENAWINEIGRVALGVLAGLALVAGGLRLAARDLAVFGHALAGTGLAILYLAIYAALNFYALVTQSAAFLLMSIVTVGAALLADRQRSQALAFIAVGGGFLTPFLVGGGGNAQLTLFSYVALLVGGTMMLSLRHQWLALNALSYVSTVIVLLAWAGSYYTDSQWLRTLLFLTLFCVLFLVILRETNRSEGVTARIVTGLLATAPVFYHIAAIVMTAQHPPAVHVYLIAFTVAGLWLTVDPYRPLLRLVVLLAALVPMFGTLTLPDGISWTMPNVVTIVAVAALHILAILDRVFRQEEHLETPELLTLHLTGLGLFALLYTALQPTYPGFRGALAALLALSAIALWRALKAADPLASLHAAALAFTLVALGIAVQFDGPPVIVGWAAEGAAAAWVGWRTRRYAFQVGGVLLWVLAVERLLTSFLETPANFTALFNTRSVATLFVVALGYALVWMFSRSNIPAAGRVRAGLHVVISFLTVMWVTAEITSYWEVRYLSSQAHLYEQMMLSLAWGSYGALLILLGMRHSYAPVRYIGMTILAVTVLKVFFYDLWELGGIYRVIGFLGFGVLLVLVSYLYQKRRSLTPPSSELAPPTDAATL